MVVVAALGGVDINPGDFIIAKSNDASIAVCRHYPHFLEVEWWRERTDAPPLCPNLHENVLRCKVKEVSVDEFVTSVIPCGSVVDLAFVFSVDAIEHVWTDVAGMSQVFFYKGNQSCSFQHYCW